MDRGRRSSSPPNQRAVWQNKNTDHLPTTTEPAADGASPLLVLRYPAPHLTRPLRYQSPPRLCHPGGWGRRSSSNHPAAARVPPLQ